MACDPVTLGTAVGAGVASYHLARRARDGWPPERDRQDDGS